MQRELCARIADTLTACAPGWAASNCPDREYGCYESLAQMKLPGADYKALLRFLHMVVRPKLYVEIGVRKGETLALAHPETHCIAIDPDPKLAMTPVNTSLMVTTSDHFFANEPRREKARGFDLAFIDGDHDFEVALHDFQHLEALAKPTSIIVLHDVIPMDARSSTPKAETAFHTGDVWRLMAAIVSGRPDLRAFTIACPPSGLGIVLGFDPDGHGFWGPLDPIRRRPLDMDWDVLVRQINIVENTGVAIGARFARLAA